jgi:hypothetical protein
VGLLPKRPRATTEWMIFSKATQEATAIFIWRGF